MTEPPRTIVLGTRNAKKQIELMALLRPWHIQVQTLRERLVKVGAWVRESVRRILIRCPEAYPWPHLWAAILRSPG